MTVPVAAGPPCDTCGQAEAIMSLMNLADYSQVKLCPACAPAVLRGIADDMEGAGQAAGTAATIDGIRELAGDTPATGPGTPADGTPDPAAAPPATAGRGRKPKAGDGS